MTFAEGGGQSSASPVGLRTKCLKPGRGSPHQAGPQLSLPGVGWGVSPAPGTGERGQQAPLEWTTLSLDLCEGP